MSHWESGAVCQSHNLARRSTLKDGRVVDNLFVGLAFELRSDVVSRSSHKVLLGKVSRYILINEISCA